MSVGHFSVSGYDLRKNKYDATSAPGVTNDITEEYQPGSVWVDLTNDKSYICLDNTEGAAVWTEITVTGTAATPIFFSVYKNAIQGIPNTGDTLVTWEVEDSDSAGAFASNRHTPTTPGKYCYLVRIDWQGVASGTFLHKVFKNGAVYSTAKFIMGATAPTFEAHLMSIVDMNGTTDYVEIYANQNSSATRNILGDATPNRYTEFMGFKIN